MELPDVAIAWKAPTLEDDGLGGGLEPAKKKPRKTKKQQLEEDDDDVQETELSMSELPAWLQKDAKLKKVVDKLGRLYPCFLTMNPSENLEKRKPIGHQLRGVP